MVQRVSEEERRRGGGRTGDETNVHIGTPLERFGGKKQVRCLQLPSLFDHNTFYGSHTKTMLPVKKSVPMSSRQSDHTKTPWPS